MKRLIRSFLDLIYPPLCLHCGNSIQESLLCPNCLDELALIDPSDRCLFCFKENEMAKLSACLECRRHPPVLHRLAAACDELGPARTLLTHLRSGNRPSLAKGAGALMAAQFLQLKWPFPDLIVPVPLDWVHRWERGYNQSLLLAEEVGAILQRPVVPLLKRRLGGYSQTLLSYAERASLQNPFYLKSGSSIQGKTVLLIDDTLSTGATLSCCAEILLDEAPQAVYGLVFCRGM